PELEEPSMTHPSFPSLLRPPRARGKDLLILTRNTEYHVRADVVTGVRPRGERIFARTHPALGLKGMPGRPPKLGEHLWLYGADGHVLITSEIDELRPLAEHWGAA